MIKRPWIGTFLFLAACGGGTPAGDPVAPAGTAAGAVDRFMQAVADSNLATMANLWGTAAGPAARTRQPPDYERRIAVMRAYLQNENHRVVSDIPDGSAARHAVSVEIRRGLCTWIVPFTVIRPSEGSWIISQVDLTAAGTPGRPCAPGGGADSTSP